MEQVTSSRLELYALNVIRNLTTFTADDLHVLENEIGLHKRDKRVIGALLKSLQSKGYIIPIGYRASQRRECHGRPIVLWKNVEGA
mgnify:CR=1 FL=1